VLSHKSSVILAFIHTEEGKRQKYNNNESAFITSNVREEIIILYIDWFLGLSIQYLMTEAVYNREIFWQSCNV